MTDVASTAAGTAAVPGASKEHVHRALASPVRRRILELLTGGEPLDAHELADRVELHRNTVRSHLAVLEEAGLVTSTPEPRDRPGRPRLLYRATGAATAGDEPHGYRFLAEVLAARLAEITDDPAAAGEAAGAAWGRYLVETPSPSAPLGADDAVVRITELLERFGFAPERDDDPRTPRVLLHRCPFLEVAREHPDVVCSIHLGIMRGALDELDVDVEVTDLIPFVDPDLCVAQLRVPATTGGPGA